MIERGIKTGRLPLPKGFQRSYCLDDLAKIESKAFGLSREQQGDVLVYVSERGTAEVRVVRNARTMRLPRYVLSVTRFADVRRTR